MSQPDEARLIDQARQGDPDALSELLERHQQRIFNVCLRMVSHRDDAAEIAQDAMVKVIEHIGDFKGNAAFATWVTRIAMNLSISHLRKRKLRRTASLETTPGEPDDQLTPLREQLADTREPGPESGVQSRELIGHLHDALGQVDEDFRAVLVLRDIEEMDYRQIAEALDIPQGTVKSRLFRGRLALRQVLSKLCPDTVPNVDER